MYENETCHHTLKQTSLFILYKGHLKLKEIYLIILINFYEYYLILMMKSSRSCIRLRENLNVLQIDNHILHKYFQNTF